MSKLEVYPEGRKTRLFRMLSFSLILCVCGGSLPAQEKTTVLDTSQSGKTVTIKAGNYANSGIHKFFFGKHYRDEWNTPVKVPVALLDTAVRGLSPYKSGGGRQSKSLRLHDQYEREYVLRSLDKSFGRALPEEFRGTFVEDLIDDQVTIGHPYSAVTIPPMAQAAKVYHTMPQVLYIPQQPVLDTFSEDYGDRVYMLEQRPDGDWHTAENFGNSANIIGTDKFIEKVLKDNDHRVDQLAYVRARLFDFLIGDWSRHEDQWRWASFDENGKTIYRPVPRDRDMAYSKFDGVLTKAVLSAANLDHLQTYHATIKELKIYGFTGRHLDRFCANEVTLEDWERIAKELQHDITDRVIDSAVHMMPPEVFPISGAGIIEKLKSRRDHLVEYAAGYYTFLARHVDLPGTKGTEYFDVRRQDDEHTSVSIYNISKEGYREDSPYYSRIFKTSETKDVRLYGIGGHDKFNVEGQVARGINIRIIGGGEEDSITDRSLVSKGGRKTNVYDDDKNYFGISRETRLHLASGSEVHAYNYEEYEYHRRGIRPLVSYNNPDRVFASIGYRFARHRWRKYPYGFQQAVYLRYSISQNAYSIWYEGDFYQAIGKWNIAITANYDAIRWTNFFGLGNETKKAPVNLDYYRLQTSELNGSVGLNRFIGRYHKVAITTFLQSLEVVNDAGQYVTDNFTPYELYYFKHHSYAGADVSYTYQNLNDRGVPTKGLMLYSGLSYTLNIADPSKGYGKYAGIAQLFVPLVDRFSLSVRCGLTSVIGKPEFFQYASVGGSQTMRGFRRDRYWGNTAFYNNNELRYIVNFRTYLMNGKIGVLALFDNGRVWYDGERSDLWHYGYGAGVLLAPFNKFTISLAYGISEDDKLWHLRLNRLL